jgi:hypothetical protein
VAQVIAHEKTRENALFARGNYLESRDPVKDGGGRTAVTIDSPGRLSGF